MVTTVITTPIAIRITFALSGMLGVHLNNGLSNSAGSGGQELVVEIPAVSALNFTFPTMPVENLSGSSQAVPALGNREIPETPTLPLDYQQQFNVYRDRGQDQRCLGKCEKDNNANTPLTSNGIIFDSTDRPTSKPESNSESMDIIIPQEKPCGPRSCASHETCVSWQKHNSSDLNKESGRIFHECFLDDGVHWNKMNPTSGPAGQLCEDGQTHSILMQSQPCLVEQPPCELIWSFVCVDARDSPHNCQLKECPPQSVCVEAVRCDLEPPCYVQATCLPAHFFPAAK